jgi:ArsR family transcriptional regulator
LLRTLSSNIRIKRILLLSGDTPEIALTTFLLFSIFYFSYTQEAELKEFIRVMKALSDPNRVKILKMLQNRVMCVCEIKEALGLAQPTVSRHLKVLEGAGLVGYKKDGLWVNYHLADGDNSPYASNLLGNLRHWLQDDPVIQKLVERLPTIVREEVCKR